MPCGDRRRDGTTGVTDGGVLTLVDAAEVMRLPEDGAQRLPIQSQEFMLEPGALVIDGDQIIDEATPDLQHVPCDGCLALVPGFVDCHTHLPFAGWRAGEYERQAARRLLRGDRARAAAGSPPRRARCARPMTRRCSRRRGRSRARCSAAGRPRSSASPATASRATASCAAGAGGRAWAADRADRPVTALLAHAVPDGYTAPSWMDEVEAMLRAVRTADVGDRARHLRRVDRVLERPPARMGALARPPGWPARARRAAVARKRSVAVAIAAGARSVDHLSCMHPRRRRPRSRRPTARRCCCRAPSSWRRAAARPGAGAGRRRRHRRARDRRQPRHLADRVAAAGHRAGRAPVRAASTRGAGGD